MPTLEIFAIGSPRKTKSKKPGTPRLSTVEEIHEAARKRQTAVWFVQDKPGLDLLLTSKLELLDGQHRLLAVAHVEESRRLLLGALFQKVLIPDGGIRMLPREELTEVLESHDAGDLVVAVAPDERDQTLILYRGDLQPLLVPFAWFTSEVEAPKPAFDDVAVTDYGQTIRLGEYEAAVDAILYEFDRDYRRRIRKNEIRDDRSLGGSIRRLRIQRNVRRDDFPGVSDKEIARIERGEVPNPHPKTRAIIAKRLGVAVNELDSF